MRTSRYSAYAATLLALAVLAPSAQVASASPRAGAFAKRPWLNAAQTPGSRASELLAQMTLPEKIDLMTGNQGEAPYAYYNAPIVRLGIPALKMADASGGVAPRGWTLTGTGGAATAFPTSQAMAATWNTPLVTQYANAVAGEVLDTGQNMLLGPDADIVRSPYWGRINETEGEDPILNGELTAAYSKAVQAKHVIADLKHYAVYNQETNRGNGVDAQLDQRTLREVYTLAFETVIKQAGLGSVMCSFNKINGVYSCENAETLTTVLRGQLHFTGFVITDYGALHDTIQGIQGGTDLETGTTTVYDGALLAAVQDGSVPVSKIDTSCLRILSTMFRIGLFDHAYTTRPLPVTTDDALARRTEEQAITLLKNSKSMLPLSGATKSIALIGADANILATPNGAPWVLPTESTTVLQGIRDRAGAATVNWVQGNDPVNGANMLETINSTAVPSSVLSTTEAGGTAGLTADYWNNTNFQGDPATVRVDPQVKYDVGFTSNFPPWGGKVSQYPTPPVDSAGDAQSAVWDGYLTAPTAGNYTLSLTGWGDATLSVDGTQVASFVGAYGKRSGAIAPTITATAGQKFHLHITYRADHPFTGGLEGGTLLLQWKRPNAAVSPAITQAVAAARKASVAIVYVKTFEGEQRDRVSLHLPESATQLISAVAAVNPRTIVVLANAGPVVMPWLAHVRAVVQTYLGGQEQGSALAAVLWGDVNPSGKLTVTYPRSESAIPSTVTNPWAGANSLEVNYSDRIAVGYKAYDLQGIAPLFPFGYGLSYTTFHYSKIAVTRAGKASDSKIHVRFRLTNTGTRAGAEAAQVYFGLPASAGEPPKRLVGFTKVSLAAGASKVVDVVITPTDGTHPLQWFDARINNWRTAAGRYVVYVGRNERATALTASFRLG